MVQPGFSGYPARSRYNADPELRGSATLPGPRSKIPRPLPPDKQVPVHTYLLGEAGQAERVPYSRAWDGFLLTTVVMTAATAAANSSSVHPVLLKS